MPAQIVTLFVGCVLGLDVSPAPGNRAAILRQ
jgi:hypothetical protein